MPATVRARFSDSYEARTPSGPPRRKAEPHGLELSAAVSPGALVGRWIGKRELGPQHVPC